MLCSVGMFGSRVKIAPLEKQNILARMVIECSYVALLLPFSLISNLGFVAASTYVHWDPN